MTNEDFIEAVCINLNDFRATTKQKIARRLPLSIQFVMGIHQWECRTKFDEIITSDSLEYVEPPSDFDKGISLRRPNWKKRIEYITPEEYDKAKAVSSTPYGVECIEYTVMAGSLPQDKRIYFLDPPTSAMTINFLYSMEIPTHNIASLPKKFIPTVEAHVIYRMTPPFFERGGDKYPNPSFKVTKEDYRFALGTLISSEEGSRGRLVRAVLADNLTEAYDKYHP